MGGVPPARRGRRFTVALTVSVSVIIAVQLAVSSAMAASPFAPDRVLINFKPDVGNTGKHAVVREVTGRLESVIGNGTWSVHVHAGKVSAVMTRLRHDPRVGSASPDYVLTASGVPNDPSFPLQWALRNTGQSVKGVPGISGADTAATYAWDVVGSSSAIVAVIDGGLDYSHPDLAGNVWVNPGGVGGCPAGTFGFNVQPSTPTCDPRDDTASGHGTHVAGIIGAIGDNGIGVSGIAPHTTLLPVKFLNSRNVGLQSKLIEAMDAVYNARQAGVMVRVVNISATWTQAVSDWQYQAPVAAAIDKLASAGITVVTASGNSGANMDATPSAVRYPCGYSRPNEVCVAATTSKDARWTSSNYGPSIVDLGAPGVNILSTLPMASTNGYGYMSGGSMAAPMVSGALALLLSQHAFMSPNEAKAALLNTVDIVPALVGKVGTGGRLDLCSLLPECARTLAIQQAGQGSVTSDPAGIMCAVDACARPFHPGRKVKLTAEPGTGMALLGWSGGCAGVVLTCSVVMNTSQQVGVSFVPGYALTLSKSGGGTGTVVSNDGRLSCGLACSGITTLFPSGQTVTLTARASSSSRFEGWSGGGCTGTGSCTLAMTEARAVTANFLLL
jgi:subtilisin family serine protease